MKKLILLAVALTSFSALAVDTQRSKSACATIYADNTAGDISAQDIRDCNVASVPFLDGSHTVQMKFPNGSISAPSFSFVGDTDGDTGIYLLTEDRMSFVTNGGVRLAIGESSHTITGNLLPGAATNDLGRSADPFDEIWGTTFFASDGSLSTPSLAFCDDTNGCDFGWYYDDTGTSINLSFNSLLALGIGSGGKMTTRSLDVYADNAYDIGDASSRIQDIYVLNVKADDAGTAVTIPAIDNDGSPTTFSDPIRLPAGDATTGALSLNNGGTYEWEWAAEGTGGIDLRLRLNGTTVMDFYAPNTVFVSSPYSFTCTTDSGCNLGDTSRDWDTLYLENLKLDEAGVTITAADCDAAAELGRLVPYDDGTDYGLCFCGDNGGTPGWISLTGGTGHTCPS